MNVCSSRFSKVFAALFLVLLAVGFACFPVPARADYRPVSAMSAPFGGSNDDIAYSIISTSDGGYALAGYTESYGAGGSDMWLVKGTLYNAALGNLTMVSPVWQWSKTYGGSGDDGANCVVQTADGGYALAGYTNSYGAGSYDMWLVKTDSNGAVLWNMTYGGPQSDAAKCVVQTKDEGYALAGYTKSSGLPFQNTWVLKTDATGNVQWSRVFAGQGSNSVIQTSDGGFALAVEYSDSYGLVKLDSSGQVKWNMTYAGAGYKASARSVVQSGDDGYAIAGWTLSNETGSYAAWLVRTDSSGNTLWSRTYDGFGAVYSMVQTSNGGFALAGDGVCLLITDASGNLQWGQTYNAGYTDDRVFSLVETSPDNFTMGGFTNVTTAFWHNGCDFLLVAVSLAVKVDSTPPTIRVLSPENRIYTTKIVPLSFTTSKPVAWMAYCLDNGGNVTVSGNTTLPQLPDGFHNVTVYAQDADYNNGVSGTVFFGDFVVDTVPVNVLVQSLKSGAFNSSYVPLSFTVNKPVSWAGYSLDGQANVTVSQNTTLTGLAAGTHSITVYAQDTLGLVGASDMLSFTVAVTQVPEFPNGVVPAFFLAVLLIVSMISAILVKKRQTNVNSKT